MGGEGAQQAGEGILRLAFRLTPTEAVCRQERQLTLWDSRCLLPRTLRSCQQFGLYSAAKAGSCVNKFGRLR